MAIRVLNDNVLIKLDEDEFQDSNPEVNRILKEGKLVLPEAYEGAIKKISHSGEIVTYGDACKYKFKVGQKVYIKPFGGINFDLNGEKLRVIQELEILAVVE